MSRVTREEMDVGSVRNAWPNVLLYDGASAAVCARLGSQSTAACCTHTAAQAAHILHQNHMMQQSLHADLLHCTSWCCNQLPAVTNHHATVARPEIAPTAISTR